METGLRVIIMERFEEKSNEDKEEKVKFGTDESNKVRMLKKTSSSKRREKGQPGQRSNRS